MSFRLNTNSNVELYSMFVNHEKLTDQSFSGWTWTELTTIEVDLVIIVDERLPIPRRYTRNRYLNVINFIILCDITAFNNKFYWF